MKRLIYYVMLYVICLPIMIVANSEYILVDEYYESNKEQKIVFEIFSKLVSKDAQKTILNQKKPVKIYLVYPGEQVSDYWRRSKSSFEARLKELGIKYKLVDYFTKPSGEIKKQAKALYKALNDDIDYLIFTLDAKKHQRFVSTILNKEKPKLILQNITTPLKSLGDSQPFLYDGFDHAIGAKILAKEYIKQVGLEGNYAVLYGTTGYVSNMRGDTFIKYLDKETHLKLVDSYYTDFNQEKARVATLDILTNHKGIKFIYACSTDIALGAISALKEKNLLGKIMINGWGGGSSELLAIQNNEMDFTVMRMNDDNGVAMAEAIKLDIQNKSDQVPLIYSGDFKLVKKGISLKKLQKLKTRAFRYSGE